MVKLYSDPSITKWTVYVPSSQKKGMKRVAASMDRGLNESVSESLKIYMALEPLLQELEKEAIQKGLPVEELIVKKLRSTE